MASYLAAHPEYRLAEPYGADQPARSSSVAPRRAVVTGSMFDTHAIARALTAADFTPGQADAVRRAAEHDAAGVDVGTAGDEGRRGRLLRAGIAVLELRLVKWIVGTGVAVAGLVVAALGLLG